ncbi:MAG: hypothetical protein ACOYZ7_00900 [Chloroflexota bacterium]
MILRVVGQSLDGMGWSSAATGLALALEQIQAAVVEQWPLFPQDTRREKLQAVQYYLAARFGAARLRRVGPAPPGAPLPERRLGWLSEEEG